MILFHFTLPVKDICTEHEMYFRSRSGGLGGVEYIEESCRIRMMKNACVSFDTFYNCFSYSRYIKYTGIDALQVGLSLQGNFRIRLLIRRNGGIPEVLSEKTVEHKQMQSILIVQSLSGLSGEGFIYVELLALSDAAVFSGGHYGCPNPVARKVKLAVVICSCRHESYVYHNTTMVGQYLSRQENQKLHDAVSMLIVDNGQTLERERLEFDRAELFYNRNLGGSGGFARGMIEAVRSREAFTHMCLMDDDVRFDPEVLCKTVSFLSIVREEYKNISVGGIMLEMHRSYRQYEMGGIWTGRKILNVRSGYDMRLAVEVLANEAEVQVDYNAWWYMCMPVSFVETRGLPMPLFIKGDDIDYGMRGDGEIVLMNGIAVWHEEFGRKFSGSLEYYIKRNELILNALHRPDCGMSRELLKLLFSCGKQIVLQRYAVVDFIIRAYEDFLKGADFLMETDGELLNRELAALNIPMLDDEALLEQMRTEYQGIQFQPKPEKRPNRLWRILTLYSYLIPTRFYDKTKANRMLELTNFYPVDFYGAKRVIQYDSDTHKGFITTLDKSGAVRFGFRFLKITGKMLLGYKRAVKSYQRSWKELAGMEAWLARLEADGKPRRNS